MSLAPSSPPSLARVAVLLPQAGPGPFDYAASEPLARGDLVEVPLGSRTMLGAVWGEGQGGFDAAKLKTAGARFAYTLPPDLCDFIDFVARYTLAPPGSVLSLALRSPAALEPERPRLAYRGGGEPPERLSAARKRVLEIAADGLARSAAEYAELAGVTPQVVRGLIDGGALVSVALPEFPRMPAPDPGLPGASLSPEQAAAAQALRRAVAAHAFSATLLDGVTGSGKTETYFEAVAAALEAGRQALILLPEIALTVQFLDRFAARFGCRPAEWHSDLSQRDRKRTWRAVARGEARVVAGARSALFLPYTDLGLIVVDEEHEPAFKQDEGVVYHARDMAVARAKFAHCPIVLASATPSLETFVNAASGRYARLHLPQRHGAAELPAVQTIDLTRDPPERGRFLAPALVAAVTETLAAGEQALLFLNRRGYAPLTLCRTCGHRFACPSCTAWLVEHRYRRRLVCHHCGYETGVPQACPACAAADSLTACGPGVERVAEEAAALWPQARLAIASSDLLHGPAQTQAAIRAMADGAVDLLIGTQLVAKGHHFPTLTLVGVVDADLGLAGGDPRARERTFQLLHQVAGRAGRAERPGRVLLQTWRPKDRVMAALVSGDRDRFLETEADDRRATGLPPFGRLAALILSGADEEAVTAAGRALAQAAPRAAGVQVLGPAPAPLARLRGRTRQRLLVKTGRAVDLQAYVRSWLAGFSAKGVRLTVDVDPQSFL